jgi:hypothetical protein
MATKNTRKALAPAPKTVNPVTPGASIPAADAKTLVAETTGVDPEEVEMVTAVVPSEFSLTDGHHVQVKYMAGTQEMPRKHAEHWYAVANGVTIYTGK